MATKSTPDRQSRHHRQPADVGDAAAGGDAAAARTVDRATAIRMVRDCAEACATAEARAAIHALVRATRRGSGTPQRAADLESATAAVVSAATAGDEDRWRRDEAATWALSRLARRRQTAGSAGRLLETLVAEASVAAAALADRDTRPGRFLVVLSRLFAGVEACREGATAVGEAVAEEIGRLVTADGAVVLPGSAAVIERVGRWTRIREAFTLLDAAGWHDETERRWAAAAAATLRLLGSRGRGCGCGEPMPAAATAAVVDAVAESGGRRARRTARCVQRGSCPSPRGGGLLPLDLHDATAATAVIRTDWGRDAVRVLVDYRDTAPHLEIVAGDRVLLDGAWEWSLTAGGRPLDADGGWTAMAWESDRKAAFLEIAAPLAGGLRLERQVVVLRRERIVLLADAVTPAGDGPGRESIIDGDLTWRSSVRLAARLEAEQADETREVLVYDGAMRCMVLPLGLPEWRVAGSGGLAPAAGVLALEQRGRRRLYAPLWIDCDPARIDRPLTWRQLTVADTRRNLPPHQAAGFRVQAGNEQWLLYRALDAVRNRTLLGCNVSSGFLLGRVRRSGEVARTVEIE